MKKLFFALIALTCFAATGAFAQTQVNNNAYCDVDIRQTCYDSRCAIVSAMYYTVPANSSITLTHCPGGTTTVLDVCFASPNCTFTNCATVDGTPGRTPGRCVTTARRGTIESCDFCANVNGQAAVIYNGLADELNIIP